MNQYAKMAPLLAVGWGIGSTLAGHDVAGAIVIAGAIVAIAMMEGAELVFKRATQIIVNIDNSSAISEQEEPDGFGFN